LLQIGQEWGLKFSWTEEMCWFICCLLENECWQTAHWNLLVFSLSWTFRKCISKSCNTKNNFPHRSQRNCLGSCSKSIFLANRWFLNFCELPQDLHWNGAAHVSDVSSSWQQLQCCSILIIWNEKEANQLIYFCVAELYCCLLFSDTQH
jgi:hypothetical protein